jgi:hypothetical protein
VWDRLSSLPGQGSLAGWVRRVLLRRNPPAAGILGFAGGRLYPEDSGANDLWHGQISPTVENHAELAKRLMSNRVRFVSPEMVNAQSSDMGGKSATVVRDPDFQVLQLVEP